MKAKSHHGLAHGILQEYSVENISFCGFFGFFGEFLPFVKHERSFCLPREKVVYFIMQELVKQLSAESIKGNDKAAVLLLGT